MPGYGTGHVDLIDVHLGKSDVEKQLDEMMDRAIATTSKEREDTIALFREEFMRIADFDMLMALLGPTGFHNAVCLLRAKRVRTRNIMTTNAVKAALKTQ